MVDLGRHIHADQNLSTIALVFHMWTKNNRRAGQRRFERVVTAKWFETPADKSDPCLRIEPCQDPHMIDQHGGMFCGVTALRLGFRPAHRIQPGAFQDFSTLRGVTQQKTAKGTFGRSVYRQGDDTNLATFESSDDLKQ